MFGWEFPPLVSGGLGTACAGLTKGLDNIGVDVTFVVPNSNKDISNSHVNLVIADQISAKDKKNNINIRVIDSLLIPYMGPEQYTKQINITNLKNSDGIKNLDGKSVYGKNLFQEVYRYSEKAKVISSDHNFDVIHCHDWMTYPAGINAKKVSGKPLVVHIHATEFDRTGGNPNQAIYNLELEGFREADRILAVSEFTKNRVVNNYGIDASKVQVVHNAVEFNNKTGDNESVKINRNDKIVLFLGRITLQKGPEYFLYAAKRVLEYDPNVKFVVAGSGDMEQFIIHKSEELGLSDNFIFKGFLKGSDIDDAYRMADLFVMPSVSEPFGITPLESMMNKTPVIISNQSGVSEVINHCLKVDFWDIDEMANKILGVLRFRELHNELRDHGSIEVNKFNWNEPASKCLAVYNELRS